MKELNTARIDSGFFLEVAREKIRGVTGINKYGQAPDGMQITPTDIWDRADDAATQQIWLCPTAARIHAVESTDTSDVAAVGTLTLAANASDNDTITIGSKVYKFQTVLTDVDGNVKIGALATNSIDNLIAAINLAAGAGTTYAASMTANDDTTTATVGAGDTMTLYGESDISSTETGGNLSWGTANLVLGTGARSIIIFGLKTWDTKESSEIIFLQGTNSIDTLNDYVIIYRAYVMSNGSSAINAGKITLTAATDSTITAQINAGEGQTQMAILGIPSTQKGYICRFYANTVDANAGSDIEITLLQNRTPDVQTTQYAVKHVFGLKGSGTSTVSIDYCIPKLFAGPCIIKMQGVGDSADMDCSAGFDIVIFDNDRN